MSKGYVDTAGGRREGWDVRVVFIEHRQHWWWNAWRPATSTELYGFADTRAEAFAVTAKVGQSPPWHPR